MGLIRPLSRGPYRLVILPLMDKHTSFFSAGLPVSYDIWDWVRVGKLHPFSQGLPIVHPCILQHSECSPCPGERTAHRAVLSMHALILVRLWATVEKLFGECRRSLQFGYQISRCIPNRPRCEVCKHCNPSPRP